MLVSGLVNTVVPSQGTSCSPYSIPPTSSGDVRSNYMLCNSCALKNHTTLDSFLAYSQFPHGLDVCEVKEFPENLDVFKNDISVVEAVEFGDTKLLLRFLVK